MIQIISDGTTHGTQVLNDDGQPIHGITRIEIAPLVGGPPEFVQATLTFEAVKLDMRVPNVVQCGEVSDGQG